MSILTKYGADENTLNCKLAGTRIFAINIYEFVHKTKEWIFNQKYTYRLCDNKKVITLEIKYNNNSIKTHIKEFGDITECAEFILEFNKKNQREVIK